MTREVDPFDAARDELRADLDPARATAVRNRVLDAISAQSLTKAPPRRAWLRPGWRPAVGVVATLAVGVLVAVALQPWDGSTPRKPHHDRGPALRLVTGGGALAGLDLDSATAAEVLEAAGDSVAAGTPDAAGADWTYVRMDQRITNVTTANGKVPVLRTTTERWTSPDGERSYAVIRNEPSDGLWIHFEELGRGALGDVSWKLKDGSDMLVKRQASWSVEPAGSNGSLDRMVRLQELLRTAEDRGDVADALAQVLDAPDLYYENGFQCSRTDDGCSGIGSTITERDRISAKQSREFYGYGMLVQQLATTVAPGAATRAIYDFLATSPDIETDASSPGATGDISIRYVLPDAIPALDIALATLDGETGRIVSWNMGGGADMRYSEVGLATGPGVGGTTCSDFPEQCHELQNLERRLERDPAARFGGAADWMLVMQVCDGIMRPDGSMVEDATPRSMPGQPASAKQEYEACQDRARARIDAGKPPFPDD